MLSIRIIFSLIPTIQCNQVYTESTKWSKLLNRDPTRPDITRISKTDYETDQNGRKTSTSCWSKSVKYIGEIQNTDNNVLCRPWRYTKFSEFDNDQNFCRSLVTVAPYTQPVCLTWFDSDTFFPCKVEKCQNEQLQIHQGARDFTELVDFTRGLRIFGLL